MAKNSELKKWQDRLSTCLSDYNEDDYNERELIYNGYHDVDADINSPNEPNKQANVVVNAVYEFIEGMVDSTIPDVTTFAKHANAMGLAKVAENMVKNVVDDLPMTRINDINERTTYIQGISFVVVNVDEKGQISLDNPHPKNVLWPKGATEIADLDYFFILYAKSKEYIKRRYGVNVDSESETYTSVRSFDVSQEGGPTDEMVTLNVAWYKDADGDVGKFAWVNNTIIENLPKYYHRRVDVCTECGQIKDDEIKACKKCNMAAMTIETCAQCGQEKFGPVCQNCGSQDTDYVEPTLCTECGNDEFKTICATCGNDKFKKTIATSETLSFAVKTPYGEITAGETVPYYVPTEYPVIERINVPVNLQLEGQSDIAPVS